MNESTLEEALKICAEKLTVLQENVKRIPEPISSESEENQANHQTEVLFFSFIALLVAEKNLSKKDVLVPQSIITQTVLSPYNVRIGPRAVDLDSDNDGTLFVLALVSELLLMWGN